MKRLYIVLFLTAFTSSVFSQALPNASFDAWTSAGTYEDPDDWATLNSMTYIFGVLTCQKGTGADVHSGAASIKLVTLNVLGQNANGLATTGTINVAAQTVDGGIPYTLRPDSITGWYKCAPQGADFGFVDFTLLNAAGTDTVGFAHFQTPNSTVSTFTYFSVAINYYNTNTPELSRCVMSSSAGVSSVINSMMVIDDLGLVFNTTGIREPLTVRNSVQFSPVSKSLFVKSVPDARISVIDITGKEVYSSALQQQHTTHSLGMLHKGLYIYRLTDEKSKVLASGKLIIQ